MTGVLTKTGTQTCRGEGKTEAEAENGEMRLQDKKHQALLRASRNWKKARKDPPLEPPEGTNPAAILISDFWSPELGNNFALF